MDQLRLVLIVIFILKEMEILSTLMSINFYLLTNHKDIYCDGD